MRIGIDLLALQSPGSRGRGVGRFGSNLVAALLERDDPHEYVLYVHDGFPADGLPTGDNAVVRRLAIEPSRGEAKLVDVMERLARANPDGLDAFLLLNAFELVPGYDPPARPLAGPVLATVMHDVIPCLYQETYLDDPRNAAWYYRRLNTLRAYDAILCNSDATRADTLRLLYLPDNRAVTIGGAGNAAYFRPDRSFPMPVATRSALGRLGVNRPFVFCLAGLDGRKNLQGVIAAFRLLPASVRRSHQLVVTCFMRPDDMERARRLAEEAGLADNLVLTGEVVDDDLRLLYQRCSCFTFPSHYEGLGLPILEAMLCGVPVIAGNNSSQIEVVGDAGLLVNAHDSADIAAKLGRVLTDADLARSLGERAIRHARKFTWARSAAITLETLQRRVDGLGRRRVRADRAHPAEKPRLAVVSPWPPKGSGISDYAARLVVALKDRYDIDLYHEPGYVPEPALRSPDFAAYDHRLFGKNAAVKGYRAVLYQMGNSYYHGFLYEMMRDHPGIVTLHDFNLAAFVFWRAHQGGVPIDNFRWEVEYNYPGRIGEIVPQLWDWTRERGGLQEACTRRRLHMNRRVFDWAEAVVVHSPWCVDQARADNPDLADKAVVIPMGMTTRPVSAEHRAAIRRRFGLPADALLFGSFGILSQGKMNVEALEGYARIAGEFPGSLFIFVGQDWENGEAKAKVEELGLGLQVRFLGRQPDEAFQDLIAVADIGIALRRPPTYGETSAALLDLLAHGVPTIVTDVATFSSYPDHVVRKIRWPEDGIDGLAATMRRLAADPNGRAALGRAGFDHVASEHAWSRAAGLYSDLIERTAARKSARKRQEVLR